MSENQNKKSGKTPYEKHGIVSIIFLLCLITFIISLISLRGKSFGLPIILTSGILTVLNFIIDLFLQDACKGYCEGCGKKLTISEFTYSKGKVKTTENRAYQKIRFAATCSSCGKSKSYDQEFTVSEIDSNGWQKNYDIDEKIKKHLEFRCK